MRQTTRKAKGQRGRGDVSNEILPFLHLAIPAFNTFSFTSNRDVQMYVVHAFGVLHKLVIAHTASVRSTRREELQHWREEVGNAVGIFY